MKISVKVQCGSSSIAHLQAQPCCTASRCTTCSTRNFWVPIARTARCVLYYNTILARGPAPTLRVCAPPLHPPGHGSSWALNPPEPADRIAGQPLAGRLRSPLHPIDPFRMIRGYRAPEPTRTVRPLHHQSGERSCSPDTPMTISWRRLHRDQGRELSRSPSHGPIPSTKGRVTPLGTPTNPSRIGCRHLSEDG